MSDINPDSVSPETGSADPAAASLRPPALGKLNDLVPDREALLAGMDRFTRFRRTRPFWGVVALLAGAYFVGVPIVSGGFAFLADMGAPAIIGVMLALGMAAAALVSLVMPPQRHFPAILAAILSVASLPLSNLGGWIIGMVLGIAGSTMIFAWTPYTDEQLAKLAVKQQMKAARKATKKAGKSSTAAVKAL